MKTMIIYKSRYGSSRDYALWLADALHAEAKAVNHISRAELNAADVLVYVGGLYAGQVNGFGKIKKQLAFLPGKTIVLCMVGMTNPNRSEEYRQVFLNNVPKPYQNSIIPFALRGNQLFSKMSFLHRMLMNAPKAAAKKIPAGQRSEDDRQFLEHFGEDVYFARRENIEAVVSYVSSLADQA